jgi:ribosomal protein L37E
LSDEQNTQQEPEPVTSPTTCSSCGHGYFGTVPDVCEQCGAGLGDAAA